MKTLFILCGLISSSVFAQSDVINMITSVTNSKASAESTFSSTPYRQKEYQSIKDYFVALNGFAEDLSGSTKLNRRYNSYLRSIGIKKFCTDILLNSTDWEQMKVNCTRNRFFLCSNEVLEYPNSKKALAETLEDDLKTDFLKTAECQ